MEVKKEHGVSGADVILSVTIIVIFLTLIGNLVININSNALKTRNESEATSYAVQEIENLKAKKYISDYDDQGINGEDILKISGTKQEEDINENSKFTGFHKKVYIQDYANEYKTENPTGTETIDKNIVKKLTVVISYNFSGSEQSVELSTYICNN